ncbi:MAG: PstC family ABC transporter permease [Anaerolineae bacterium]
MSARHGLWPGRQEATLGAAVPLLDGRRRQGLWARLGAVVSARRVENGERPSRKRTWSAVRVVTLLMALVPVAVLLLVVVVLVAQTLPALRILGLRELDPIWRSGRVPPVPTWASGEIPAGTSWVLVYLRGLGHVFSGRLETMGPVDARVFGLVPTLWGTVMVTAIALFLAVPVSLCIGFVCTEFSLGPLSRVLEATVAALAGIPPVFYGLTVLFVVPAFVRPKLAGDVLYPVLAQGGQPAEEVLRALPGLPQPFKTAVLPYDVLSNSVLLGGMLLALLIIPFMTPLIVDALRSVPRDLREASLGLGANRWYTVRRVILPGALPGLVTAVSLGALKGAGDVMIVLWATGSQAWHLPEPLWDVLERTAPLSATAAALCGGVGEGAGFSQPGSGVGHLAGLLLLLLAFAVLALASLLQDKMRRRFAA